MSFGDGNAVASDLSALLSKDAATRCQTLLALADHDGSLPQLWPFLDDPDATVRVAAVHALWQTGTGRDALDRLVEVLRGALVSREESARPGASTVSDAALMAGSVLQQIGPAAVGPLSRGLRADAPEASLTVLALADLGTDEAIRFLRRLAEESTSGVAQEAARALADLESTTCSNVLDGDTSSS